MLLLLYVGFMFWKSDSAFEVRARERRRSQVDMVEGKRGKGGGFVEVKGNEIWIENGQLGLGVRCW